MKETVLVTGGAGFIGSHLCEALLLAGKRVISLDSLNDYYDPSIKERNHKEIINTIVLKNIDTTDYQLIVGDIRDKQLIEDIFKDNCISTVVHLAACAGVRPSIVDPVLYTDVNINGTVNMLEACKKYKIKRFVFASSSSVYGNNDKVPFAEIDPVDHPISPYAATKKAGELICHTYHSLYNINMACLRFFTVYGPRQRPDLAIHKFTKLINNGESIPFYGDGSTERDYTYIGDIIDGITKAIVWVTEGENKYEVFNLGESNTISLKRMVSTIENALGEKANINQMPMQPGDVNRTNADVTKAKKMLGYNPTMEFEQGIEIFTEWFREVNR